MRRETRIVALFWLVAGCAASVPGSADIAGAAACGSEAVPILEVRNVNCEAQSEVPQVVRCDYEVRQAFTREVGFLGAQWRRESKLFYRENGAGSRWCYHLGSTQT